MTTDATDRVRGFCGKLFATAEGDVWGHCWDPARPDLRCWVDILLEDRCAATWLACRPDEDLAALGIADDAHGFRGHLPPASWPDRADILIWARVSGASGGFAQILMARPFFAPKLALREAALVAHVANLSDTLGVLCDRAAQDGATWRAGCRALAAGLRDHRDCA